MKKIRFFKKSRIWAFKTPGEQRMEDIAIGDLLDTEDVKLPQNPPEKGLWDWSDEKDIMATDLEELRSDFQEDEDIDHIATNRNVEIEGVEVLETVEDLENFLKKEGEKKIYYDEAGPELET